MLFLHTREQVQTFIYSSTDKYVEDPPCGRKHVQAGRLQRTVFINKIRMLQRTEMLQRTRRNTISRRSTRVRMTFRAFQL